MHDLIIALIFVTLVASPVIAAVMPTRKRRGAPERQADGVEFPVSHLSASR